MKSVLQKQKPEEGVKCIKCKERNATKEDQMCDNCRFMVAIDNIIESRK
jgi:hypothetical protein